VGRCQARIAIAAHVIWPEAVHADEEEVHRFQVSVAVWKSGYNGFQPVAGHLHEARAGKATMLEDYWPCGGSTILRRIAAHTISPRAQKPISM